MSSGAGIAGLTAAYLLTRAGIDTVVIDDGPIGGGEDRADYSSSYLGDRRPNLQDRKWPATNTHALP